MYRGPAYIFIPERIEGEVLTKWRYINPLLLQASKTVPHTRTAGVKRVKGCC